MPASYSLCLTSLARKVVAHRDDFRLQSDIVLDSSGYFIFLHEKNNVPPLFDIVNPPIQDRCGGPSVYLDRSTSSCLFLGLGMLYLESVSLQRR